MTVCIISATVLPDSGPSKKSSPFRGFFLWNGNLLHKITANENKGWGISQKEEGNVGRKQKTNRSGMRSGAKKAAHGGIDEGTKGYRNFD